MADIVQQTLLSAGLSVYCVQEIKSDKRFLSDLRWALAESHAVIILLTRSTLDSPDLALEVGLASAWNKPIYVVFDGVLQSEIPVYLREHRLVPIVQMKQAAADIGASVQPLTEDQVERLLKVYRQLAVPTDQLLVQPMRLTELARELNRAAKSVVSAQTLAKELVRLRKQGRLPRVRR